MKYFINGSSGVKKELKIKMSLYLKEWKNIIKLHEFFSWNFKNKINHTLKQLFLKYKTKTFY